MSIIKTKRKEKVAKLNKKNSVGGWRFNEGYETRAYDILAIKTFIYEVSYDIKYHKYMIQNIIKIGE